MRCLTTKIQFLPSAYVHPWKETIQWTIQLCQAQENPKDLNNLKRFMKMINIGKKWGYPLINFFGLFFTEEELSFANLNGKISYSVITGETLYEKEILCALLDLRDKNHKKLKEIGIDDLT